MSFLSAPTRNAFLTILAKVWEEVEEAIGARTEETAPVPPVVPPTPAPATTPTPGVALAGFLTDATRKTLAQILTQAKAAYNPANYKTADALDEVGQELESAMQEAFNDWPPFNAESEPELSALSDFVDSIRLEVEMRRLPTTEGADLGVIENAFEGVGFFKE